MIALQNASAIRVNGTEISVLEAGQGSSLVFVHGGVSDLRTWSGQFGRFSKRFHTIAYSRRYHVPNQPIAADASDPINTHVEDLEALVSRLADGPVHVVGHSWGALIVLLAAMHRPERYRSLVLIEPPLVSMHVSIPPGVLQMLRLFLRSPRLALGIAKLGGGALNRAEKAFRRGNDAAAIEHFGRGVLGDKAFEALSKERYQQVWDNRGPDRAQALYGGFPDLIGADFDNLSMPVLLVGGTESPAIFERLLDSLVPFLPMGRKCMIPGASHIVHEDAPDTFESEVLAFLE